MDITTLGIAVRSDEVDQANRSLERFAQVSGSAERAAKGVGDQSSKAGRMAAAANDNAAGSAARAATAYGQWEVIARRVAAAVGTVAGALATGALIQYADAWSDMQSRVGAAIRDMEAAPEMMQRLVDIANASYSPLDQTVEVYSRNVAVLRDMGGSAQQAADFTEALNHALVLTATRGERAASVQNALSKAMAVGKLQADGLETVLANGGAVAEALADQLGTTVNGLRKMASDGKITGDVIANALITRLDDLAARAAEMPATVGDAFTRLRTNLTAFVGQFDQATGSSQALSAAIMWVADNLDLLARAATVAGSAMFIAFAPALLSQIAFGLGYIGAAGVAAMRAITVAVMANPLGFIAVAVTTALVALYQFRDEIRSIMGDDLFNIVKSAANFLINSFKAAYADLEFIFSNFGDIVASAILAAVNAAIRAVNAMVRAATDGINTVIRGVNSVASAVGMDGLSEITPWQAGEFEADSRLSAANAEHETRVRAIMDYDNFASSANGAAEASRTATDAINTLNSAVDASGAKKSKAQKEAEKLAEAYKQIVDSADEFIRAQMLEASLIGMTEQSANALRYEFDLLNEARRAGIALTDADRAGFKAMAEAMAEAEGTANSLREAFDFMAGTTKGFFYDLLDGLLDGKSAWEAFAGAAVNALQRIGQKLIDLAMDQLINSFLGKLLGAFMGGMGGGFGRGVNYFPPAPGGGLYQSGGWTGNGPVGAAAGVVHGQEFVVRAGPAAQHRQMLEGINAGRLVSANSNAPAAANGNQSVDININVSGARGNAEIMEMVSAGVRQGITAYDRDVAPSTVHRVVNDPRARG